MKDELVQLEETRSKVEEEKEKSQENIAPYKYKIKQKTDEKTKVTRDKEAFIVTCNSKVCTCIIVKVVYIFCIRASW